LTCTLTHHIEAFINVVPSPTKPHKFPLVGIPLQSEILALHETNVILKQLSHAFLSRVDEEQVLNIFLGMQHMRFIREVHDIDLLECMGMAFGPLEDVKTLKNLHVKEFFRLYDIVLAEHTLEDQELLIKASARVVAITLTSDAVAVFRSSYPHLTLWLRWLGQSILNKVRSLRESFPNSI
jgi:hypothetical protein